MPKSLKLFLIWTLCATGSLWAKVHLQNGSYGEVFVDWRFSENPNIFFARVYNSKANAQKSLGKNFFHNFNDTLEVQQNYIDWKVYPSSKGKRFLKRKVGSWTRLNERIIKRGDEYRLFLNSGEIRFFDIKGNLKQVFIDSKNKLTLERNSLSQVIAIKKNEADFLKLFYDPRGNIDGVELAGEVRLTYRYDLFGRLQKVLKNDRLQNEYQYFSNRLNLITNIIYSNGHQRELSYYDKKNEHFVKKEKFLDQEVSYDYEKLSRDLIKANLTSKDDKGGFTQKHFYEYASSRIGRYLRSHKIIDTFGERENIYNYLGRIIKVVNNGIQTKILYSKDGKSRSEITGNRIFQYTSKDFGKFKTIKYFDIVKDKRVLKSTVSYRLTKNFKKIKSIISNKKKYEFTFIKQKDDNYIQITKNKRKFLTLQYEGKKIEIIKAQIHGKGVIEFLKSAKGIPSFKVEKNEAFSGNVYLEYKKALNEVHFSTWSRI